MKKTILFLASILMFTACYEDYVKDYDKTAALMAYQYDMRTFVLDEGEQFKVTVYMGSVMTNKIDRKVSLVKDPSLLDGALACMKDQNKVSGNYVSNAFVSSSIDALTELPDSYYRIDGLDGLTIRKNWHTASITLKATEQMRNDPKMFEPYYAVAFRITKADVDEIPQGKDFSVIAVKCENRFYGVWKHSYRVEAVAPDGAVLTSQYVPVSEENVHNLTTVDGNTVVSDMVLGPNGQEQKKKMSLTFKGNEIEISSEDGVVGTGHFNGDKLLQNRKLYLEYYYASNEGYTVVVKDTLSFRNRYRDGVNEWQDENPEHYK